MKRSIPLIFLVLFQLSPLFGQRDFYTSRWSRVYNYELKSLPKSALSVVDTIYSRAKKEKNIPQFTKALIYQSKFALTLNEDAELIITKKFQKEIAEARGPLKNVLESILANTYWDYFRQNRWKYYDRSHTEKKEGSDFRLWDSETMFTEIHSHYQNSLRYRELVQGISLATINDILSQAENSKTYRPTLYDLLAHNALDFYETSESYIIKAASDFEMNDPRYFEDFENLAIATQDSLSPEFQSLTLYKLLLRFHKADKDQSAYINNELERLQYIKDKGHFENVTELHREALTKLKAAFQNYPASTLIDFQLASLLFEEGNRYKPRSNDSYQFKKRDALNIVEKAIASFPKSDGAEQCRVLREEILRQHLEVTAERYLPIEKASRLLVNYINLDSITIFDYLITDDFETEFYRSVNDSMKWAKFTKIRPDRVWNAALQNLKDYQFHSTEVVVPELKKGTHYLVASLTGKINPSRLFAYTKVQVTNLALIESTFEELTRYQLVNRNSGAPVGGAKIIFKAQNYSKLDSIVETLTTDKNGFVEFKRRKNYTFNISASVDHEGDRAEFGDYYIYQHYEPVEEDDELNAKVFLFSDRSIYRPGQTVFFKGIFIKTKGKKSSVVAGQYVQVTLDDANSQEIGSLRLKTNSYGSFSGEFKLPANGLTGDYTITADEDEKDESKFYDKLDDFYESTLEIAVEEYKRPTFEVTFDPVKETFELNDSIRIIGNAITFSGTKVPGAKVSYHVKRNVRYPNWYYWNRRNLYSPQLEISQGDTITNTDGAFFIKFKSIPDEKIAKDQLPIFEFEITADVTDVNGETRTGTSTVKVGYVSLIANVNSAAAVNRKVPDQSISVTTENLNSQAVPAKGTITIYKSRYPLAPQRPRPWTAPDLPQLTEEQFTKLFPNDPFIDANEGQFEKGKRMVELPFNTGVSEVVKYKVDKSWELGSYLIELVTSDEKGNQISARHKFDLFDPSNNSVADNKVLVVETDKPSYEVGDIAKIKIGSASKDLTVAIDIERKDEIVKTYVKHLASNFTEIQVPITEGDNDGLMVHYAGINYNAFFHGTNKINVLVPTAKMEIETISFKDKLQPGSKETWSFEIKHSDPLKKDAEVLASMYDASLDQFKSHQWTFDPKERDYHNSSTRMSGAESFGTTEFTIANQNYLGYQLPQLYFDQFDDFGFSITGNYHVKQRYYERIYSQNESGNHSTVTQLSDKNLKKGFISGRITGADGLPIAGVNVLIKGTTVGTVTEADGRYTLPAGKGDVVVFSFIGYSTAESKVGKKNILNVTMGQDTKQLSEVVVTALGVDKTKRSLSFSITEVVRKNGEGELVFADADADSVSKSESVLHGRVAGVQITGMPGGAQKLMIRGSNSLQNPNPLYVVDGVVTESSKIDKDDLEAIQVLKGDAAIALYGSQGANGVIIITTKSGQKKLDEELAKINARKNFNETAFFFPHLTTDENGRIQFTFTTPESLTRWKLQLLAHNRDVESVIKTLNTVTQKEFMITPNAPRFLRVGDEIQFSAKVINLTGNELRGNAALMLTNAVTGDPVDPLFQNQIRNQPFKTAAKGNTQVVWKLKVPPGVDAVQYKVVAKAGNFSDGEQNALPVLSNRTLVTETLPMSIRAGETKTFTLDKLKNNTSATLQNHRLTLEVTTNPAWYAVQALPYLMEFPYECSEQTFARYYANTLASFVANSNPKIREVFDKWSSSGALISNLEKNQELKSTIIQETPWLRDAQSEYEQKKRIALLFDLNTMKDQRQAALDKIQQLQLADGGFTWFAGGRYSSRYITQHVASGFGHLRTLKVVNDKDSFMPALIKAINFLDGEIARDYNNVVEQSNDIKKQAKTIEEGTKLAKEYLERQQIGPDQIHYLYMRSSFPDIKIPDNAAVAIKYYSGQSAHYWPNFNLYAKGMTALIQYRNKNASLAADIIKALKENSIVSEEMGMYWKENKAGWYWSEAPVETQALLIEAFAEIESNDKNLSSKDKQKTIDDLRIWLLKNKQTNQWQTTKATTEAIYALLLDGTEWLTLNDKVEINVGGKKVAPPQESAEAGTGYFKTSWKGNLVTPEMGKVKLTKKGEGIAWAGLYWQYFEDLDKITPSETPLKLSKKVFVVSRTDKGELLNEVDPKQPIAIGTLLRVRIELKTDRDMEFLHMKDMRASGLEPVDVLSEYKWQGGLGYYQSTKDASTNFFFDAIKKGIYVFEYDLRVNNKGDFSNGITTIQCMYAPEFTSHSEGIRIKTE